MLCIKGSLSLNVLILLVWKWASSISSLYTLAIVALFDSSGQYFFALTCMEFFHRTLFASHNIYFARVLQFNVDSERQIYRFLKNV